MSVGIRRKHTFRRSKKELETENLQTDIQFWKIYLDTCCLSCFFHDQTQTRILNNFMSKLKTHIHGYKRSLEMDTRKMTDVEVYELGIKYLKDQLDSTGFFPVSFTM